MPTICCSACSPCNWRAFADERTVGSRYNARMPHTLSALLETTDPAIYRLETRAPGPAGALPLTPEMLLDSPSGDVFGLSQSAGMGWKPEQLLRKQFLILSTQGG